MKKLLCGLAVLPLLSATALAQPDVRLGAPTQQPVLLTETQMDNVTAGWSLTERDLSNTSLTLVSVYRAPLPECTACYLDIDSRAISVDSIILGGL